MSSPYHHALSSVHKWGGEVNDYLPIHEWFDASREMYGDFRHRALRHHSQGLIEAERVFGPIVSTTGKGREVPVRYVGEQHVIEDCGFVPCIQDWFSQIQPQNWMNPTGFFIRTNKLDGTKLVAAVDFVNNYFAGDTAAAMAAIARIQKSGLCSLEPTNEEKNENTTT